MTSDDDVVRIALQPDGKIVLAATNSGTVWLARFLPDGNYDPSFTGPTGSAPGYFHLPDPPGVFATFVARLIVQHDGRIVVGSRCSTPAGLRMCLSRFVPSGAFDATFDGPGTPGDGQFVIGFPSAPHGQTIEAITQQPDGKLLLAGRFQTTASVADSDFALVRLTDVGAFDTTLGPPSGASAGAPGWFALPVGTGFDAARAVAVQPDGRILLAGSCNAATTDFCVVRILSNGVLDESFDGPSGTANGKFLLPIGPNNDNLWAAQLQPDGKLILAGTCAVGSALQFCLARLNHDGSLDTTFDGPGPEGNGLFTFGIGPSSDRLNAMALQPDGKLMLAGTCFIPGDDDLCLARLHGGPQAARQCTLDVDGDGTMTATRDTLILTRIALGLTGPAALNGISFAPHATRTTWPAIRDHLVTQCGMSLP